MSKEAEGRIANTVGDRESAKHGAIGFLREVENWQAAGGRTCRHGRLFVINKEMMP